MIGLRASDLVLITALLSSTSAGAWSTMDCPGTPGYRTTWPSNNVWPVYFLSNAPSGSWLNNQLQNGMVQWNDIYGATDELGIYGTGYGYCTSNDGEGFGVAGWDDGACHSWGPYEQGVTLTWSTNCIIDRSSLYVNSNASFPTNGQLLYTASHELGHYLGADHEWYELTVMGYSDEELVDLYAPDHSFMRAVYGSGNSALPDLYVSKLGLAQTIIPDSQSIDALPAPFCSGSCYDLQPGDTVTVEATYGNAGTQYASNVDIELRLGGTVIGSWTWSPSGGAQQQGVFTGTVPTGISTGSKLLELMINPGFAITEGIGPTPGNSISWTGFTVAAPAGWTCSDSYYADGLTCDCGCGVFDPDCTSGSAPVVGCTAQPCYEASCSSLGACQYNYASGSCSDGQFCTVNDTCSVGDCLGQGERDCSAEDGPCSLGVCNETDDRCDRQAINEGSACDDGLYCTVANTCAAGQCEGAPRDCSLLDDACNVGVCDEGADACQAQATNEGGTCDDGDACTDDDSCASGTCAGTPRDCSGLAGPCEIAFCDAATGACVVEPVEDGALCEDGAFCTVGDQCSAGVCVSGAARDCSAAGDPCNVGVCDDTADACLPMPANEGGACDDGSPCTLDDVCASGVCGGAAKDCSDLDGDCVAGVCDEADGSCGTEPANVGGSCETGSLCTEIAVCTADGVCLGQRKDCSDLDTACSMGMCDEATGGCVAVDRPDGSTCSDGNPCTVDDVCQAGACTAGGPRDCSARDSACAEGVCDEAAGGCIAQPINEGGACEDDDLCTQDDTCADGVCVGGAPVDCSALDDACVVGVCRSSTGACDAEALPNGASCTGAPCTTGAQCSDGVCEGGAPRDCSSLDDDDACVVGLCDATTGDCVTEAVPDCVPSGGCSHVQLSADREPPAAVFAGLVVVVLTGVRRRRGRAAPRA